MASSYLRAVMALSIAGMLLVPAFGLLLRFQPQFVHRLHASASSAEINCYLVGSLYAGVLIVCSLFLIIKIRLTKKAETQKAIIKRHQRFGLPFEELESDEFVKAMDDLDRRIAMASTFEQVLKLPTEF